MLAVPSFEIAPVDSSVNASAPVAPVSSAALSSSTVTVEPCSDNDPAVIESPAFVPRSMFTCESNRACPVTARLAPSVFEIPDARAVNCPAVLAPVNSMSSFSSIATTPAEVTVNVPNRVLSGIWSPSVIAVAVRCALPVTVTSAPSSVIVPVLVSTSESAWLASQKTVSESSWIDTAPVASNLIRPKFVTSAGSLPSVIAVAIR